MGRTLPYPVKATSGGEIAIKTHPKTKNRSVNYHRLNYGYLNYAAPLTPDKNDQETTVRALCKRLCRPLPTDAEGGIYTADGGVTKQADQDLLELADFVDKFAARYLAPLDKLPGTMEWIDGINHPEWRKEELRAIARECGGYESGWKPTKHQCETVKMFMKLEDYAEYKEGRGINSRGDHFKVYSGPAFHAIEEAVYRLPYFAKHMSADGKMTFIDHLTGRVYATDFTAFESHFTPTIMAAIECRIYLHMLQKYPELGKNICCTIMGRNVCKTATGVSAELWGRRMSGDMCTSLGNGLTNILLALFIAYKKTGDHQNLRGLVEGDDGLFTIEGARLDVESYRRLGFTIKMEEHADARTAGFCQMYYSQSHQYVKDPAKVLSNFGWSGSCVGAGSRVRDELLRAKALSLAYNLPHCPVVRALADRALVLTQGVVPRYVNDGYHKPPDEARIEPFNCAPDTRALFERLYGITVAAQLALEREITAGKDLSSTLSTLWVSSQPHFREMEEMMALRSTLG